MLVVATAFTYGLERPLLAWRRKTNEEGSLARSTSPPALELTSGPGHLT
jgi:hypothetical protein